MTRHYYIYKTEKGFTLFELLLVITIVGLILTFSVSVWLSMKTSHQISATATLLETATNCLENYVIHSGKIPSQAYFISHCSQLDPWGTLIAYENNGDNQEIINVTSKIFRDGFDDHPDAAWIIASFGPDKSRNFITSATLWDCSSGDDLCKITSKNQLYYELNK